MRAGGDSLELRGVRLYQHPTGPDTIKCQQIVTRERHPMLCHNIDNTDNMNDVNMGGLR